MLLLKLRRMSKFSTMKSFHTGWDYKLFQILVLQALVISGKSQSCEEKLHNCTDAMQPVLDEVRYMFPTNQQEIEIMCKMWSQIMECIRKYMVDCATTEQRSKFNKAVSNSLDSVHAICSSERYRRDYLENASCFKKVSMDSCGTYFKRMVDSAYNPKSMELHICCAYKQYEKCVSEPIQRMCGPQTLHLLEDSMASLKTRCNSMAERYPKSYGNKCPVLDGPSPRFVSASRVSPPKQRTGTSLAYSTSAYLVSPPYTSLPWTPRTVIYPLPVTQYSRVSRSTAQHSVASFCSITVGLLLGTLISAYESMCYFS